MADTRQDCAYLNVQEVVNMKMRLYIDSVIEMFDFYKVQKYMEYSDWKWMLEGGMKIPTIIYMKDTVRELFKSCVVGLTSGDSDSYRCSTGGFSVRVYKKDKNKDIYIKEDSTIKLNIVTQVDFIIESAEDYDD